MGIKLVWHYKTDKGHTGSVFAEEHGDAVREVVKITLGSGFVPRPGKNNSKTHGEYTVRPVVRDKTPEEMHVFIHTDGAEAIQIEDHPAHRMADGSVDTLDPFTQ